MAAAVIIGLFITGVILVAVSWLVQGLRVLPKASDVVGIVGGVMIGGSVVIFVGLTVIFTLDTCRIVTP